MRTLLVFFFGLMSEMFAFIAIKIQPDIDVDFNYLKKEIKC